MWGSARTPPRSTSTTWAPPPAHPSRAPAQPHQTNSFPNNHAYNPVLSKHRRDNKPFHFLSLFFLFSPTQPTFAEFFVLVYWTDSVSVWVTGSAACEAPLATRDALASGYCQYKPLNRSNSYETYNISCSKCIFIFNASYTPSSLFQILSLNNGNFLPSPLGFNI